MSVGTLTPKCTIFDGCLYPKAVQTTFAFHLKAECTWM